MQNHSTTSDLFSPVTVWTDMGLRALEMTLSSTQNISDGLERLTRASASPMVIDEAEAAATEALDRTVSTSSSGLALTAQIQRTTFDLLVQAWQQFMTAAGALAAMGAGRSPAEPVKQQQAWLLSMGKGAASGSTRDRSAAGSRAGHNGQRRYAGNGGMEHAAASSEPRRRSRGGRAKTKARSRRS